MPEFQRQKRRSLTDEQLYEEYHRTDELKSKVKPNGSAKKVKKPALAKESSRLAEKKEQQRRDPLPKRESKPVQKAESKPVQKAESKPAPKRKAAKNKSDASAKKTAPHRKKQGRMTLYYVLAGIVAVGAVSILSVTVLFNISKFEVVGDTSYSDEEIIAACGIENGDNLLRINIDRAEESVVSDLVYIDSAKISRGFPNRLAISVEPAKPVLSFASGSSYYIISERGRLLDIDREPADCPVVKGYYPPPNSDIGAQLEDDEDGRIALALKMMSYMRDYGLSGDCEINLTDTLNILMTYDDRVEIELGASTQLEDKFYHAGLLLKDEITAAERCTLILSNPDRVVKRPIYDNDEEPEDAPEEEPSGEGEGDGDTFEDDYSE